MEKTIRILKQTRTNFLNLIKGLSIEELNQIPSGFNNNLVWNFGHILVTQQGLCYRLSGLQLRIDYNLVPIYRKDSKPETFISEADFEILKSQAFSLLDDFVSDYENGLFQTYQTYPTSYGITLNSVEDAIEFNVAHEGLHLGYAMALKRALLSK